MECWKQLLHGRVTGVRMGVISVPRPRVICNKSNGQQINRLMMRTLHIIMMLNRCSRTVFMWLSADAGDYYHVGVLLK